MLPLLVRLRLLSGVGDPDGLLLSGVTDGEVEPSAGATDGVKEESRLMPSASASFVCFLLPHFFCLHLIALSWPQQKQISSLILYLLVISLPWLTTTVSHPHCPVGQLRSRVVGPEYVGHIQGSRGGRHLCAITALARKIQKPVVDRVDLQLASARANNLSASSPCLL